MGEVFTNELERIDVVSFFVSVRRFFFRTSLHRHVIFGVFFAGVRGMCFSQSHVLVCFFASQRSARPGGSWWRWNCDSLLVESKRSSFGS